MSNINKINEKLKGKDSFFNIKDLLLNIHNKNRKADINADYLKKNKEEYLKYKKFEDDYASVLKNYNSQEYFCKLFIYLNAFLSNLEKINFEKLKIKVIKNNGMTALESPEITIYPETEGAVITNKKLFYNSDLNITHDTDQNMCLIKYNNEDKKISIHVINEDPTFLRIFSQFLNDGKNLKIQNLINKLTPILVLTNNMNLSTIDFSKFDNEMICSEKFHSFLEINELLNDHNLINELDSLLGKENKKTAKASI